MTEKWSRPEGTFNCGQKCCSLCLRKSCRKWGMAPSTEAVIWFWLLPGSCLSLAALLPCLISCLDFQPKTSADTSGWATRSKYGVKLFLQPHFCCIDRARMGCKSKWSILQMWGKESSSSHVGGHQQPSSDGLQQCWNEGWSKNVRWDLVYRS